MLKRRLTISDVKSDTLATSPHYFDRASMKFFGQTMRDFKVRKSPKGKFFILAKGKNGYSFRQYVPGKRMGHGELRVVRGVIAPTLPQIESYIRNH